MFVCRGESVIALSRLLNLRTFMNVHQVSERSVKSCDGHSVIIQSLAKSKASKNFLKFRSLDEPVTSLPLCISMCSKVDPVLPC